MRWLVSVVASPAGLPPVCRCRGGLTARAPRVPARLYSQAPVLSGDSHRGAHLRRRCDGPHPRRPGVNAACNLVLPQFAYSHSQVAWSRRWRRSLKPARPYIDRLIVLSWFTWLSTELIVHDSASAAPHRLDFLSQAGRKAAGRSRPCARSWLRSTPCQAPHQSAPATPRLEALFNSAKARAALVGSWPP